MNVEINQSAADPNLMVVRITDITGVRFRIVLTPQLATELVEEIRAALRKQAKAVSS